MHDSVSVHSNILRILYMTPNSLPPSFFEPSLSKLHLKEDGRRTQEEIFARHPIIGGVKDEREEGGSRPVRRRARSERRATGDRCGAVSAQNTAGAGGGGRGRKGAQLMMTRGGTRAEPGPRTGSPTTRRRHTTECWCTGGRGGDY